MKAGKSLATISAAVVSSLILAASASADTVVVHDDADSEASTTCTLRHAMNTLADGIGQDGCVITAASGDDVISFDPSITDIQLEDSELVWSGTDPLSIAGPGIASLSISAASDNRVFRVQSGTVLTISGMTIANGTPVSPPQVRGGCLLNQGTLTLTGVRVTNCTSNAASNSTNTYADGAAVGNEGTLTINDSRIDNNQATATNTHTGSGGTEAQARGAIYSEGTGGVTLNNTTVEENEATATDAEDGNSNAAAYGGLAVVGGGSIDVSRSTFELNIATATEANGLAVTAGGIYSASPGNIELTTVARNRGDSTGLAILKAGGIFDDNNTGLAIRSSTIALNGPTTGSADGGNFFENDGPSTFSNTILASPRGNANNCGGAPVASAGFNVDYSTGGASCFLPPSSTDLTSNPLLSSEVVNNGGPTETIALQPTSPAIDAGLNAGITLSPATQDQRGLTRPVDFSGIPNATGGNGSDIGAVEVQLACAGQATPSTACSQPPGPTPTQPVTPTPTPKKKKCKKAKKRVSSAKKKKCKKKKRKG